MKILKTANYEKLAHRVSFKHICDDCNEFTYLTKRDMMSKSVPRCNFCGSTWLEPVTEHAKGKMQQGHDAYKENVELTQDKTNFQNKSMDRELSHL